MKIPFSNMSRRDWLAMGLGAALAAYTAGYTWTLRYVRSPLAPFEIPSMVLDRLFPERPLRRVEADNAVVRELADALTAIEPVSAVRPLLLSEIPALVHYRFDCEVTGRFWRPLTPSQMEAVRAEHGWPTLRGDCKARATLTASVARRLGLPFRFAHAPFHMWVEVYHDGHWRAIGRAGLGRQPDGGDLLPGAYRRWLRAGPEREHAFEKRVSGDLAALGAIARLSPPQDLDRNVMNHDPRLVQSTVRNVYIPVAAGTFVYTVLLSFVYFWDRRRPRPPEAR